MMKFTLSFDGKDADAHQIDFYDTAQALLGFQRSLAIATHLVLNGKVITQAPSLKNARILAEPPEKGSWQFTALLITGITASVVNAPRDTMLGHLVYSAYDYIISETIGFHVDYDKSLGRQYEELQKDDGNTLPVLGQSQLDSAIEKCTPAITDVHRPIVKSETAVSARLFYSSGSPGRTIGGQFDPSTHEYITRETRGKTPVAINGKISSYNINTYKGRIFVFAEKRPVSFELADSAKSPEAIEKITNSLRINAVDRSHPSAKINCTALETRTPTGKLKNYYILKID